MSRFARISEALEASGWSIKNTELSSDCWWAKEIWALRSEWSPKGTEVFLSFLIDPSEEIDDNNPAESSVWAVALTQDYPQSRHDAESTAISIKRRMSEATAKVVKVASEMRMAS